MENLAQYLNIKMFHYTDYNRSDESYYHYHFFLELYEKLDKQYPMAKVQKLFKLAVKKAVKDGIQAG